MLEPLLQLEPDLKRGGHLLSVSDEMDTSRTGSVKQKCMVKCVITNVSQTTSGVVNVLNQRASNG